MTVKLDVVLNDRVSAPAKRATDATDRMARAFYRADKMGRLRDSRGRFVKLGHDIDSASVSAARFDGTLGQLGGSLSRISGWVTGIGSAALASFGIAATAAAGFFSKAVFEAAKAREVLSMGLGQLRVGSITAGTGEFEKVKKLAIEMRTELISTAEIMRDFAGAGFSIEMSESLFKTMKDLQGLGLMNEESMSRALLAIRQIQAAGRLQGDELNQLGEAGIEAFKVYEQLEQRLGKTRAEVLKLKEAGKISSDVAIDAIMGAMQKEAGGRAPGEVWKDFTKNTVSGAFETAKSLWGVFVDDVAVKATPAFEQLGVILNDVAGAMGSDTAIDYANSLGSGFNAAAAAIEAIWTNTKAMASGFDEIMKAGGLELINDSLERMGVGSESMTSWADGANALGKALAFVVIGAVEAVSLTVRISAAIGGIVGLVTGLPSRLYDGAFAAGAAITDGIANGISAGIGKVQGAISSVSSSAYDRLSSFWKFGSPSKLMVERGSQITEGQAIGIEKAQPMLLTAFGGLELPAMQGGISSPAQAIDLGGLASLFATSGGGAGGAGKTIEVSVEINVQGGGSDTQETWEALRPHVRREVERGIRSAGDM